MQITLQHPKFIPNTINLVRCIRKLRPTDPFALSILGALKQNFSALDNTQLRPHLHEYLLLLTYIAEEPTIEAHPYIARLQNLLHDSDICEVGNWATGQSLLTVCRALMNSKPLDSLVKPLGDLLHFMWERYNDIDVMDSG